MNAVISLVNKAIGKINGISIKIPDWAGGGKLGFNIPKIPQLAQGGIVTQPTVAMIGEGNESEAVLPLSALSRMLDRGEASEGQTNAVTVNFAPVIHISGGGSAAEDVKRGLQAASVDLKREIEKILRDQRRLSFA